MSEADFFDDEHTQSTALLALMRATLAAHSGAGGSGGTSPESGPAPPRSAALVLAGAARVAIAAMGNLGRSQLVQRLGCAVLGNLAHGDAAVQGMLGGAGAVQAVAQAMERHRGTVEIQVVCWDLMSLSLAAPWQL